MKIHEDLVHRGARVTAEEVRKHHSIESLEEKVKDVLKTCEVQNVQSFEKF